MFNNKEAGKRIRKRRIELGLQQEIFSESIGISTAFLGLVERGTRFVRTDNLIKISEALGVSTDYILKGSGEVKVITSSKERILHFTQNILSDVEADYFLELCIACKECKYETKELKWVRSFFLTYLICLKEKIH